MDATETWVRGMVHHLRMETEMDAELRVPFDACAQDLLRRGTTAKEASRRARLEFEGMEQAKEQCRGLRRVKLVDSAVHLSTEKACW